MLDRDDKRLLGAIAAFILFFIVISLTKVYKEIPIFDCYDRVSLGDHTNHSFSCVIERGLDDPVALFTLLLAGIAIIQAVALVLQLRLLNTSLSDAKQTAKAAKDTAQATLDANRPWLDFDVELLGPMEEHPPSMARIRCKVTITNVGKSPATWTNVRALVEQSIDLPSQDLPGFAGPSVFPITPVPFGVFAFAYELNPTGALHGRVVQLRVVVKYGAPGMNVDGQTSKNWSFRGPFMGAIDFKRLPIDHREHLHLQRVPESDFAI